MKLTPELIARSSSEINSLKDRELDLRGLKIPVIENLGVTRDQNDMIDFTDNDIRYLGNFPKLHQLRHINLANNLVTRIDPKLHNSLPSLNTLVLTNNSISDLGEISHLSKLRKLEYVSFMGNPISREKHYREFVIWKIPKVRVVDFRRVRDQERALAKQLFETSDGRPSVLAVTLSKRTAGLKGEAIEERAEGVARDKTFEPGRPTNGAAGRLMTAEERKAIEEAIEKSESLEEIRRLEERLKMGYTIKPESKGGRDSSEKNGKGESMEEKEEEEEEEEER
ncbi:L domain-like protein [Violaceomyces palustris]|uniref:L domain-like protein n=1 Tax=Violaceomyces palustris TaxID=1673888 RepID=A0ACD0P6F2_9BASI|nr:L domain-like protein [Violaceomyces palustris]